MTVNQTTLEQTAVEQRYTLAVISAALTKRDPHRPQASARRPAAVRLRKVPECVFGLQSVAQSTVELGSEHCGFDCTHSGGRL